MQNAWQRPGEIDGPCPAAAPLPRFFGAFAPLPSLKILDAQPGENLDYTLDLGPARLSGGTSLRELMDAGDAIARVSVASRPSGTGEIACTQLAVAGTAITLWMSGGVAGREYLLAVTVTMASGRVFVLPVWMPLSRALASWPPAGGPPSWNFGPEITCMAPSLVTSVAPAAALLLATVPCTVRYVHGVATQVGGWLMLVDAAAIPASGATVNPVLAWPLAVSAPPYDFFPLNVSVQNGAVLLFSIATLPNLYTPSATALLAGETL